MSSFREHVGFGTFVAVVVTGIFLFYSLIEGFGIAIALFAAIVLGSFMPDVDSDSSIVFSIIYSLLTSVVVSASAYISYVAYEGDIKHVLLATAITLVVMWIIVRKIFMKLTKHRGMFHSVPAICISYFVAFYLALFLGNDTVVSSWFGGGFAIGYFTHLVLDEIHAGINLQGKPFRPNHMLGTALKFYGKYTSSNIFTYIILVSFTSVHFL